VRGIVWDGKEAAVTTGLEVRDPRPNEVAVNIVAAGVCHSDLSVIDGTIPFPPPVVMGHEGAGVVEAVGSAVDHVKPGDHVVITTLAYCGHCGPCNTGHPTWCKKSFGNIGKPFTLNGDPVYNFAAASVFADQTVVQANQVVPISKDVPLESAALIGCGVITGVGAVFNRARVRQGEDVTVFGVGGIGLNVIQAAKLCDAGKIIAVDTVAEKESLAREFGATHFVQAGGDDTVAQIKEIAPDGVPWAFECVGHPAVIGDALQTLGWGGNCVIIGVPPPTAKLEVQVTHLTHIDRGIMGCRYGSAKPHHDVPLLVQLYLDGKLKLDELVSATYPLEDFQQVVDDMHEGKLARGVLTFS
jgi:S-(hydroxymethyl)glutathione dehydrogenase/alcohol dehydrogenase